MKKKVKVHILPIEEVSVIFMSTKDKLLHYYFKGKKPNNAKFHNLYLTSDEKIEEGWKGWAYKDDVKGKIFKHFYTTNPWYKDARKIVATTDKSLKIYESETLASASGFNLKTDDILLPQIPQSFIKEYVKSGGKIDEVEIELDCYEDRQCECKNNSDCLNIGIKVDSNNCVIVHSIKDSWSKEEVETLVAKAFKVGYDKSYTGFPYIEKHLGLAIKSWIKENAESNQEQATQTNEEPTINPDLVIQREPEMIKENKNVPETKQSNMNAERNILISMIRRFF